MRYVSMAFNMKEPFFPPFHIDFDESDSEDLRAKMLINMWEKCRHENGVFPDESDFLDKVPQHIKSEYFKWLSFNNLDPGFYDGSGYILCPLIDEKIDVCDCHENRETIDRSVPDIFKQKPDWRGICENCKWQAY